MTTTYNLSVPTMDDNHIQYVSPNYGWQPHTICQFQLWMTTTYNLSVPTMDDNHIQFVSSNYGWQPHTICQFQLWMTTTYILSVPTMDDNNIQFVSSNYGWQFQLFHNTKQPLSHMLSCPIIGSKHLKIYTQTLMSHGVNCLVSRLLIMLGRYVD